MGFSLTDLDDEEHILFVNFWNWHPTVELIGSFRIVDADRLECMHVQCAGARITETEARDIGERIQGQVLPEMPDNGRVKLDLSITTRIDDGRMHYGTDAQENYGATREWLLRFSQFRLSCKGFDIL